MKTLKMDILGSIIYILIEQIVVYYVNYLISLQLTREQASIYFFATSILFVCANIFLLGGGSVILKYVPILRKKFKSNFKSKLYDIFIYFLNVYLILFSIIILLDVVLFYFDRHKFNLWYDNVYNISGVFLFGAIFLTLHFYLNEFLRSFNKIIPLYSNIVLCFIIEVILFYTFKRFNLYFPLVHDHSANLLINFLILFVLNYLIPVITSALYVKFKIFKKQPKKINNQFSVLEWRNDIKHYTLHNLQSNINYFLIIILQLFSTNSYDAANFSYFFGLIYLLQSISFISKGLFEYSISKYLVKSDYFGTRRFIRKSILALCIVISIIAYFYMTNADKLLRVFSLNNYDNYFRIFIIIWSLKTIFNPILGSFLLLYSKNSLKTYSITYNTSFVLLLLSSIVATKFYNLIGMFNVSVFILFLFLFIEIFLYIYYINDFYKNRKNLANIDKNL